MSQDRSLARRIVSKGWRLVTSPLSVMQNLYQDVLSTAFKLLLDGKWLIDYLPRSGSGQNTVALVRLDLIGDFVLWLDSAKAYRDLYPDRKIVLCANSVWAELAHQQPWWDEVIEIDLRRLRSDKRYCLGLMLSLHWRGLGIVIQPTFSRELAVDRLVRATGAQQRIGQEGDTNNITPVDKRLSDTWYTKLIKAGHPESMELAKNADFVRGLGAKDFRSGVGHLRPSARTLSVFKPEEPYILLSPGASWLPKAWPVENFAQLANELFLQYATPIVLCGSPAERALCENIVKLMGTTDQQARTPVHNLAGQTTLTQLLDVIAGATLLVSNDSGNIHLAAALRVPSVCIVGGGHSARFMPYVVENDEGCVLPAVALYRMECFGCHWRCKYEIDSNSAVPCVANVAVSMVSECCRKVLMASTYQPRLEIKK
jgi:ADP-heptose:LPS heptosyltransferase